MAVIQKLSQHVANLIAAGEVVERPASVVKELLENAVDAGAKHITVEIKNGGVTFIRVTDDGCGMAAEDAETAFLRHATSKIRTAEDLSSIETMGFRGEALAAIASVSHVELMTRTAGAEYGVSLRLDGGVVQERGEIGCPIGTTMIVRNLFYNTPARMKFLKRDAVEGAAVAGIVQKQALSHPNVAINLIREGSEILRTDGSGDLRAAVYAVYGRAMALDLVPVSGVWGKLRLEGFSSKPETTRGNRSYQLFFVNERPVESKLLQTALEQAYTNQMMVGRFPICVLHLTLPPDTVDVNVHPAKTEVKFLTEQDVADCVRYGVQAALQQAPKYSEAKLEVQRSAEPKQNFYQTMTSTDYRAFARSLHDGHTLQVAEPVVIPFSVQKEKPAEPVATTAEMKQTILPKITESRPVPISSPIEKQQTKPIPASAPEPQQTLPLPGRQDWKLIGEVMKTYLIIEDGEKIVFLDKHAAHERILFEKYCQQDEPIMAQTLIEPISARFSDEDAALLLQKLPLLRELGYELEDFGGSVLIRQVPSDLDAADAEVNLEEICEALRAGKSLSRQEMRNSLLHTVACKAAIKAGWNTERRELEALCREVMSREDIRYCPHGRPVCVSLSRAQLERLFKRS